jgi:hypothetical protein
MGGLSTTQREFDVLDAASAWAQAKEELLEAKTKRSDAPLCDGKYPYPYGDHFGICRIAGRAYVDGAPPWCAACEAWNDAQLSVEKAQRQLKKVEKALTAAIKAWRRT